MKNNFNLDELEEFLSDSAEQHRMYPSDKVWRNINKELHGNKSWPALTFGAILAGAIITAGLILVHPDKTLLSVNLTEKSSIRNTIPAERGNEKTRAISRDFEIAKLDNNSHFSPKDLKSGEALTKDNGPASEKQVLNAVVGSLLAAAQANSPSEHAINHVENTIEVTPGQSEEQEGNLIADEPNEFSVKAFQEKSGIFGSTNISKELTQLNSETALQKAATSFGIPTPNAKKWSSFFYVTPSISYRYLTEAKVVDLHYNGPVAPNFINGVNKFVRHSPTFGFEFGGGLMYQLSKSVRVRMGLQANIRGYSIDAYASKREPSTIVLSSGYYNDSIVAMSTISNIDGYQQIKITNRYFELSAPLSLDLEVAKIKKVQFFVAAGLQPTYQFNKGMYMVSSDYKNYVQNPDLARHFNINTSLEAFLSYKKGGYSWQVGPQLRYQLLSGAINQYPVREHLFDYGLKIGVVKTLK
jgi:hypothetical protein